MSIILDLQQRFLDRQHTNEHFTRIKSMDLNINTLEIHDLAVDALANKQSPITVTVTIHRDRFELVGLVNKVPLVYYWRGKPTSATVSDVYHNLTDLIDSCFNNYVSTYLFRKINKALIALNTKYHAIGSGSNVNATCYMYNTRSSHEPEMTLVYVASEAHLCTCIPDSYDLNTITTNKIPEPLTSYIPEIIRRFKVQCL